MEEMVVGRMTLGDKVWFHFQISSVVSGPPILEELRDNGLIMIFFYH